MGATKKEKRILLIVDPQIDFITGSLPVPDAETAMNNLARYVSDNSNLYNRILVTCDRHPLHHSSFRESGGRWPSHCVESSVGAAVWPPLMDQLMQVSIPVDFFYKGERVKSDEYSIFQTGMEASALHSILKEKDVVQVDICGLAGDVCVKSTFEDASGLYPRIRFRILEDCTASLDGGEYIRAIL